MKLSFHGAAKTVTGSKHLLALNNGTKILLDCGLFQGLGQQTDELNASFGFEPKEVSFVILSHAHIDHTGLLPKLVKEGFSGPVYCTPATRDLTEILLFDSAEIQTYETEHINKKRAAKNLAPYEPLYTKEDVITTLQLFETVDYNTTFTINDDIEFKLTNTGHLIGSAAVQLVIKEEGKKLRITFSGDVGRYRSILLPPPAEIEQTDYLILETTYGNKHHDITFSHVKSLNQWIQKTCIEKGGQLVIPAFSVGRTQEILYTLNQLELEKRLPDLLFFVDSPMSMKATEVIKQHAELFNERLQQVLRIDDDPFAFKGLKYVESIEDSRKLVEYKEPCVIISASGTADAGRVRHHIFNSLDDEKNSILMAGYCGPHSLGGQLLSGATEVELYGETVPIKAEIGQMNGMSAHGDCDDLCKFVSTQEPEQVKGTFLVHGEYAVQQEFCTRLERKGWKNIQVPALHQEYVLH